MEQKLLQFSPSEQLDSIYADGIVESYGSGEVLGEISEKAVTDGITDGSSDAADSITAIAKPGAFSRVSQALSLLEQRPGDEVVLLSRRNGIRLADQLGIPAMSVDIERALMQVAREVPNTQAVIDPEVQKE